MPSFPERVGEWLLDLMGFVGLALGGAAAAAAPWLDTLQQDAYHLDPSHRLTPAQLAEQVVKGVTDEQSAAIEALYSGINESRFSTMVQQTGNPPGPGELLDMLRRNIIDDAKFEHGVRQGYIKTEWVEQIRAFRWQLLNVGEAVAGVVQNHIDEGVAHNVAAAHGITPADFQVMVDNAGNPPGPMEMLNLLNRGVMNRDEVVQGMRESRLKNKYIDALLQLAVRKVPMRTITTLITHGAIDDGRAIAMLRELGYVAEDAQAIVTAAHFAKAAPQRELSMATIKQLYVEHMISRDDAIADMVRLNYTPQVAAQILDLADHDISTRDQRATITKIRNAYLSRRIDRANAAGDLDAIGLPATQRDAALKLWDLDRDNQVALLTPAQIVHAGKVELFSPDEVLGQLTARGYSDADAMVLAMLGGAIPLPPKTTTGG